MTKVTTAVAMATKDRDEISQETQVMQFYFIIILHNKNVDRSFLYEKNIEMIRVACPSYAIFGICSITCMYKVKYLEQSVAFFPSNPKRGREFISIAINGKNKEDWYKRRKGLLRPRFYVLISSSKQCLLQISGSVKQRAA